MLAQLKELLYRSHVPGMKVVMGPFVPAGRRARWVLVLAVFTALTCWDIARTVSEYLERHVAMDIELSEVEDEMPLPAITVCNLNPVRKSVLCDPNYEALNAQKGAAYWRERLCNGRAIENVWMSEEVLKEVENFTQWVMRIQRKDVALAKRMGHQRKRLFLECTLGNLNCRNDSLLFAVPYGRYGTCYCFNFLHGFSIAQEDTRDIYRGLRMILDTEIEEYLPLSAEVGFKVMIHEPGVEADYNRNGVHIPPEFVSYLRLEKMTLQRLEPPYPEPCRHDWPPGYKEILFTQTRYTREKCLAACLQLTIVKRCGCMDYSVRTFNITGVKRCCSGSHCQSEKCVTNIKRLYSLHQLPCACYLPCYEAVYRKTLTHLGWPAERRKYPYRTLAKLIIYLDGEKIEKRRRYPQYPLSSLVTNIGGTMGIYLGLSFVTLFSIADIVATALVRTLATLKAVKAVPLVHKEY